METEHVSHPDPSLSHLMARVAWIARRASDLTADQLPPGEAAAQAPAGPGDLVQAEHDADEAEAAGTPLRLRDLARTFHLEPVDVDLLLVALAPELDIGIGRLYALWHGNPAREHASPALAAALLEKGVWPRLIPTAPLPAQRLLSLDDSQSTFPGRRMRVPDRVALHLLGDEHVAPPLRELVLRRPVHPRSDAAGLVRAIQAGTLLFYLHEHPGASGHDLAAGALQEVGLRGIAVDAQRLRADDDPAQLAMLIGREARLTRAAVVIGPIEPLLERGPAAVRTLAELQWPTFITGRRAWDPDWSRSVPLVVDVAPLGPEERAEAWRSALAAIDSPELDAVHATAHFRLDREQIARAGACARLQAAHDGGPITRAHVMAGARAQNAVGLEQHARRIEPRFGWDDLVLPTAVIEQLAEVSARLRHREQVLEVWQMGRSSSRGQGITALFAGESGTGKTMSAEVIAGELDLDLYVIDLSAVLDKYIGETEKNLDRIFSAAEGVGGVLLFDEADALFGKRSEVKDSHDRYANVEVAYLLQRMEHFDGIALLTTNLRTNLDEAFTRRLDAIIEFPLPTVADRRALWAKKLAAGAPLGDDIDLDFLASAFGISGGNIQNAVLTAAFLAAEEGGAVGMPHVIRGVQREYRKLGRLALETEFGPYFPLVRPLPAATTGAVDGGRA